MMEQANKMPSTARIETDEPKPRVAQLYSQAGLIAVGQSPILRRALFINDELREVIDVVPQEGSEFYEAL